MLRLQNELLSSSCFQLEEVEVFPLNATAYKVGYSRIHTDKATTATDSFQLWNWHDSVLPLWNLFNFPLHPKSFISDER